MKLDVFDDPETGERIGMRGPYVVAMLTRAFLDDRLACVAGYMHNPLPRDPWGTFPAPPEVK